MSDFLDQEQRRYLEVMGIDVWERREQETAPAEDVRPEPESTPAAVPAPQAEASAPQAPAQGEPEPSPVPESPHAPQAEPMPEAPPLEAYAEYAEAQVAEAAFDEVAELDWGALEERIAGCTACEELVVNRTRTVFGVGNRQAELLVIGEAPGAEEDQQGEPFVGRAGKLLNAMLKGIGFARQEVYIANVLKCRPPNNRDPAEAEVQACAPFLQRQIELIKPRVILAVGRIAAQNLLHSDVPIGKLRGQLHRHQSGVPLVVTYHPAYLLRSPLEKRKAWLDLCLARRQLQQARERQE